MKLRLTLVFAVAIITGALGQSKPAPSTSTQKHDTPPAKDASATDEQLYREHCARCHRPPDEISPNAVRAVLQHMRVRANLRAQDEQALLKYLAPGR